jgi:hypothetical protein
MKPVKQNPNNPRVKIDGAVSIIMCMKGWLEQETGGLDDFLNSAVRL